MKNNQGSIFKDAGEKLGSFCETAGNKSGSFFRRIGNRLDVFCETAGPKTKEYIRKSRCIAEPLLFFVLLFLYYEFFLQILSYKALNENFYFPLLTSVFLGLFCFGICSLIRKRKWQGVLIIGLAVILSIWFEVQYIYRCIFGSFMPLFQVTLGANAITSFYEQLLYGIGQNIFGVLLLLLPIPLAVLFFIKVYKESHYSRRIITDIFFTAIVVISFIFYSAHASYAQTVKSILSNPNASTESSFRNTGLYITTYTELKSMIFPDSGNSLEAEGDAGFYSLQTDNVMDIDFDAKLAVASGEIRELLAYFKTVAPSSKNEYTGIAKDMNLVLFCAESFSPHLIDPEITPALYYLSNNGFIFKNFYNSFPNTTTNGEYTLCTGLLPDMSRSKTSSSFEVSANNYLPFCLANEFGRLNVPAIGYHNNDGNFYNRKYTHTNMGLDFRSVGDGLDMQLTWPASDLEMVDLTGKDYIGNGQQFFAYYMTFSGHHQYDWTQAMCAKHRKEVASLEYSDHVKAYIACNLELEYALQSLMQQLEDAGQLDNTVIALTTDHYPYGLTDEEYSELAGKEIDIDFERYHSSFICYVPGFEEPVTIDDYCCSMDILPTLLNLFGLEYDSRLLAGRDILADEQHYAVLANESFLTDTYRYNSETGKAESYDGTPVSLTQLAKDRKHVENLFAVSTKVLNDDFYGFIFDNKISRKISEDDMFLDIDNLWTQARVAFLEEHGIYSELVKEYYFSINSLVTRRDLLKSLWKLFKDEDLCTESNYLWWAFNNSIIDNADALDTVLNYEYCALYMYRASQLLTNQPAIDNNSFEKYCNLYPELPEETIRAMFWAKEVNVLLGGKNNEGRPAYSQAAANIKLNNFAIILQRYFVNDLSLNALK